MKQPSNSLSSDAFTRSVMVLMFCVLAACVPGSSLRAEMTLLKREMFATPGNLTPAAPGVNFTQVFGTLYRRPGGPRLAGSPAASADIRDVGITSCGRFIFDPPANNKIFVGGWFLIEPLQGKYLMLMSICDIYGHTSPNISITDGKLGGGILYSSFTQAGQDYERRWIYLGIAVHLKAGTTADVRYYSKYPGQPMQSWAPLNNGNIGIGSLGQAYIGIINYDTTFKGRMGAPSLYTFTEDDFSDITYPPDLIEPASGLTWHCDPANGNDANDGATPQTAWKTAAKINEESRFLGMLPANGYAEGDTLVINTGGADLDLGGEQLQFSTSGLNVRAAAGQEWIKVKSCRSLSSGAWQTTSMPHVFATTDTQPNIVAWEDDKFMTHPLGTSLSAVQSQLSSTPGSFWTDGTMLYIHPFGSTDPRSDGKRYERSYYLGCAVVLNGRNMNVQDLHVGKTCLADNLIHDPLGGYCLGNATAPGKAVIKHCYLYYGAKHNFALTEGAVGDDVLVEDVQAEQGTPYPPAGYQTVWVSFNHQSLELGIIHRFHNCRTTANAGLIGSTTGQMASNYPVFYAHNLGSYQPDQFELLEFIDCEFGAGGIQGEAVKSVQLERTRCGIVAIRSNVSASQCAFQAMNIGYAGRSLTERNCIHHVSGELRRNPIGGTVDIQGCTVDARAVTSVQGGVPQSSLYTREDVLSFTFKNNLVLMPAAAVQASVFATFGSTDTVQMSHNAYSLGGNTLIYQYNDGVSTQNRNLAQWQALGFDAGSFTSASMNLTGLVPIAGSPLINAGLNLGPLIDYTGSLFRLRNDIGAYEAYPTTYALWQAENFTPAEMAQPSLVNASASYLKDGVSNLVKYALGLYPDQPALASLPQFSLDLTTTTSPVMTVGFQHSRWAGDLTSQLQFSQDLVQWDSVPPGALQVIATGAAIENVQAVITFPSGARGFVRLKVTQP